MAHIELMPEVFEDFDRILEHMARFKVEDAPSKIRDIIEAIRILGRNPLIGRPVTGGKHELVIGRGSKGYVAVYRYAVSVDTVFVLAVRSQREDGYKRGSAG